MDQRCRITATDLPALLPFLNQVGHQRHRLPVAAIDVLREYVEYRARRPSVGRVLRVPAVESAATFWSQFGLSNS
jgi:hypothetical protein